MPTTIQRKIDEQSIREENQTMLKDLAKDVQTAIAASNDPALSNEPIDFEALMKSSIPFRDKVTYISSVGMKHAKDEATKQMFKKHFAHIELVRL